MAEVGADLGAPLAGHDPMDETVADAAAGIDTAIADLYRHLYPALRRFVDHQLPGEGDDLASDTWIALAPKLATVEGGMAGVRRLAFTIARRRVIDARRKQRFRRTDATDDPAILDRPIEARTGPEALVDDRLAAQEAIDRLTAGLSPDAAEVILLRVVGGLSAEEVGAITGRSAGAVRVMQHRAVSRLVEQLDRGEVTP